MRFRFSRLAVLAFLTSALLLLLLACGTTGNPPSTTTPGGTSPTTGGGTGIPVRPSQSLFLYGSPGQGIFAARIDPSSGQVFTATTLQTPLGGFILFYGVDPKGRFLYTSERAGSSFGNVFGATGIGVFTIDRATGVLASVPAAEVPLPVANKIVVDPSGQFLYTVQAKGIDAYSIDQTSGRLTRLLGAPFNRAIGNFVDVSPDGRFLFNVGGGQAQTFTLDSSGRPTAVGGIIPTGGSNEWDIAVTPDGHFLIILNAIGNTVSILQIGSTGLLTELAPLQLNSRPISIAFTPSGQIVYIATTSDFGGGGSLFAFRLDSLGVFTELPGSPFLANTTIFQIAADFSGRFLYVPAPEMGGLLTFRIDPSSGALTQTSIAVGDVNGSQTLTTTP